ncbi:MAG TPA: MgtC/SapB family protein, partial [Terriglobia bacterium]|nr:MgtC/SapB family protein [Terriglobia bacterium]
MNDVFDLPDWPHLLKVTVRLVVAAFLGGLLGLQREREGKAAGLRTHMLVALGAALFTIAPLEVGMSSDNLSRVIQGVATGVGFLGAGTILKKRDEQEIYGLTTAAGVWLTAAVGISVGMGQLWIPAIGVVLALIILSAL